MCIKTWQEVHPDFEIKRWDETNSDLSHPYVQAAYAAKKWAFVADFVRFQVLVEYGGVYLDTDMLLLKPISTLLDSEGFIGFEDDKYVSAGIIGSVINQPLMNQVKAYYKASQFNPDNPQIINITLNKIFKENGLTQFNVEQNIGGINMFPSSYFYSYSFAQSMSDKDFEKYITPNSIALHLWNHSWGDEFSEFRKGNKIKGLKKVASKILKKPNQPLGYYKKVAKNIVKTQGKKG
jgi:mannosyltransferase OCH1-like enzyme